MYDIQVKRCNHKILKYEVSEFYFMRSFHFLKEHVNFTRFIVFLRNIILLNFNKTS